MKSMHLGSLWLLPHQSKNRAIQRPRNIYGNSDALRCKESPPQSLTKKICLCDFAQFCIIFVVYWFCRIAFASLVLLIQLPSLQFSHLCLEGSKQSSKVLWADHQMQLRRWGHSMPICSTKMQAWQKNSDKMQGIFYIDVHCVPLEASVSFFSIVFASSKAASHSAASGLWISRKGVASLK